MISIQFESGHETLRGYLHQPEREDAPAVLILPGFADTAVGPHNLHVEMARALAQTGFVVLRFDYRGQGESDGDFKCFTARSGLIDAHSALNTLREQPGVDSAKLGVAGYSLGGTLAAELAAEVSEVRALVLLAPVAYPQAVFNTFFTAEHLNQAEQRGWMDWLGWPVGREYVPSLSLLDPLTALQHSKAVALVLHGTADIEVPPENARAYADRGAALHWLEGGDHQFSSVLLQQQIVRTTCDWFRSGLEATWTNSD